MGYFLLIAFAPFRLVVKYSDKKSLILLKRDSVIKAKSVYIKIKDGVIYKLNIGDLK